VALLLLLPAAVAILLLAPQARNGTQRSRGVWISCLLIAPQARKTTHNRASA
jgi:hypothetical protein